MWVCQPGTHNLKTPLGLYPLPLVFLVWVLSTLFSASATRPLPLLVVACIASCKAAK